MGFAIYIKECFKAKNNYGNSNISPCKNQGCQNQRDATILHPASHQHPSWHLNGHRKLFIDIWATPIINGNQKRVLVANFVAIFYCQPCGDWNVFGYPSLLRSKLFGRHKRRACHLFLKNFRQACHMFSKSAQWGLFKNIWHTPLLWWPKGFSHHKERFANKWVVLV